MPDAEFFEQFGLFAVKNFLDRDFCLRLCDEMRDAPFRQGTFVNPHTGDEILNEDIKKRGEVTKLAKGFNETVSEKLLSLKPMIAEHYAQDLDDIQAPKYSIYETGDFYRTHTDADHKESAQDFLKVRKVSSIIFLNEESAIEKEGSYCGGNLTFYGLMENESFGKFGLPLVSEPGMLITFLPTILHEVTPVTAGVRYTIASWFI